MTVLYTGMSFVKVLALSFIFGFFSILIIVVCMDNWMSRKISIQEISQLYVKLILGMLYLLCFTDTGIQAL